MVGSLSIYVFRAWIPRYWCEVHEDSKRRRRSMMPKVKHMRT